MTLSAGILGVGSYVPPKVVTNQALVDSGLDTSDDWIWTRTGIRERRIADSETATSDMAVLAAQAAFKSSGVPPSEIDLVLVATTTPDYLGFPSTACLIQDRLGIGNVGAFDLAAACSGFGYALTTAAQFVKTGHSRRVLVIGADSLSKWINWNDRGSCILFGDGAGAVVVGPVSEGKGVLLSEMNSDGSLASILMVKAGGTRHPLTEAGRLAHEHQIYMEGRTVFKVAVKIVVTALEDALAKVGMTPASLDLLVLHQANMRIIDAVASKLNLRPDQLVSNIDRYGNTSAASIPIALDESVRNGRLSDGMTVATVGFGAGFTWTTSILRWGV